MTRQSLAEYLADFHLNGRDIAFVHRNGYRTVRWSYSRIAETASQAARELERLGVRKGDRVVIWGRDCAEWVAAFYGCVLRGAVAVPLDRIASAEFGARIAGQVQARVAFGSRERLQHLSGIAGIPFEDFPRVLGIHDTAGYASPPLDRSDPVEILFTSGATADPKGVVITHGNVLSNLAPIEGEIAKYRNYERPFHPIRFLSLLPLSHVFGQFMGLFVPQLLRGTVLFQETASPSEIVRTIRRERVSVLVAVPRMLESLKDCVEREIEARGEGANFREQMEGAATVKYLLRWFRFRRIHRQFGWKFWAVVSGGAALDSATEEFWRRLGFVVVQGYGMTETTSLISVNHPFGVGHGSIGKVLPGREMKLDETGEILVRGESIASTYWQEGTATAVAGEDGWLRTGDLGAVDDKGNLYFKGRKKNVIVTPEGMNVYPQDLENALRSHPEVKDCVILPLPRQGNAVPGAVLLLHDAASDGNEIVRRANESLSEYQAIRQWLVWPDEDFPRTSTQKPRMNAILEWAQSRLGSAPERKTRHAGSVAEIVARIARRSPEGLRSNDSLTQDLNLSSLDRVELLSAMEDRFQVDLNESEFTAATTLRDLEEMLREPAVQHTNFSYPRWVQRWPVTWIRAAVYNLVTWPATQLLSMPKIRGRERLRGVRGPVLVICNHVTYLDIGFVLAAFPRHMRRLTVAMDGERLDSMRHPPNDWPLWERWAARTSYWLMTPLFHVFPLPQHGGFRESFQFAGEAADKGYSVLVFPEGVRTSTGKMAPFRSGIGVLAASLQLPVVPMRIHGLWEIKASKQRGWAPWGAVQVNIGEPLRFAPDTDPQEITRALENAVHSL